MIRGKSLRPMGRRERLNPREKVDAKVAQIAALSRYAMASQDLAPEFRNGSSVEHAPPRLKTNAVIILAIVLVMFVASVIARFYT